MDSDSSSEDDQQNSNKRKTEVNTLTDCHDASSVTNQQKSHSTNPNNVVSANLLLINPDTQFDTSKSSDPNPATDQQNSSKSSSYLK